MTINLINLLYTFDGDNMKVYLDVIILVNTLYDFLILSSVSILLKKHITNKRMLLSILIGFSSIFVLYIKLNKILLLIYKFITSLLMVKVAFNDHDTKNELFYFYIITIIIGGSQYLLTGSYYRINIITMLIISPIIIYMYIKSFKSYILSINKIYDVILIDQDNVIKVKGYMDTGNTLLEPISKKPVIIINNKYKFKSDKIYYVPCNTINSSNVIKCYKLNTIIINNKIVDVLVSNDNNYNFKKYDVVLNEYIRENISC